MEFLRAIQCYSCFTWCEHLRNECPRRSTPVCSNCSATDHSYKDCTNSTLCYNCSGDHPATARICPAYTTAVEALKPRIAEQLAHYITGIKSDTNSTHDNAIATKILKKAALASDNIDDFVVSLFKACDIFTKNDSTDPPQTANQDSRRLVDSQMPLQSQSQPDLSKQNHQLQDPQPSLQQKSTKKPSHSHKMPVHRFLVDTSKHLVRKPNLSTGRTPSPNGAVRHIQEIKSSTKSVHDNLDSDISTLRNYGSDTDSDYTDECLLNISNDDTYSQTSLYTRHNLSLEDIQPYTLHITDRETAKYYYYNKMMSSNTPEEKKFYYRELLDLTNNLHLL